MSLNPFDPAPQIHHLDLRQTKFSTLYLNDDQRWPQELWIADETIDSLLSHGWGQRRESRLTIITSNAGEATYILEPARPGYMRHGTLTNPGNDEGA